MIVSDLCDLPEYWAQKKRNATISILHLCTDLTLKQVLDKIEHFTPLQNSIEHILVYQTLSGDTGLPKLMQNLRIVYSRINHDIPALFFNLGLMAASGNWIWLWGPDTLFSPSDILEMLDVLRRDSSSHLVWLQPPGDATRGQPITIDAMYNGLCPMPDSLIWRAGVFDRLGCFDPHLVVRDTFAYEMLLRTVRYLRIVELPTRDGTPAVYAPEPMRDIVLYTDSRTQVPRLATLSEYVIDDLSHVEQKHGPAVAWRLYLNKILPYYYRYRHWLPPAQFISPQSLPRTHCTVFFTKARYETSNELTFWNYERHFRGRRCFLFSYFQSKIMRQPNDDLDIDALGDMHALVSVRTADSFNADLMRRVTTSKIATAYLIDDDLLHFHEYGGTFAGFRPGQPHYESMLQTIQAADVVIGFNPQIEQSVAPFNKRYVHNEVSVPLEFLPQTPEKPSCNNVFRFGYAGSGYRTTEFAMLRPAIERICIEYGDKVQFSLWGMNPQDVQISGNVEYVPFSTHYFEYLERLSRAGFDAMLVPLMLEPAPKKAKNLNKFLEAVVANAVGLYSDVPSYQIVQHGVTGFKIPETSEAWYQAMKMLIEMPEDQRAHIRSNALTYVRTFFSTPVLATTTEAGILTAQFHQRTRAKRGGDGRPLVAFFFPSVAGMGGGEIQLWRRLDLVQKLGIRPLIVISNLWVSEPERKRVGSFLDARGIEYVFVPYNAFFTTPYDLDIMPTEPEVIALREFFAQRGDEVALVHSLALVPAVGQVCSEFGIPHLASIYGIDDDYEFPGSGLPFKYCDLIQSDSIHYAQKWSRLLKCEWICARETVPVEIFDLGFERLYVNPSQLPERIRLNMVGTFMQRKSQLATIQALDSLPMDLLHRVELHLYGSVDVYPEYGKVCRQARAQAEARGGSVEFHGHVSNIAELYRQSDIVLSVSSLESFPSAIKEATAAGCLVIASKVGGIPEMMVDGVNCFLVEETSPESIANAILRAVNTKQETILTIRRNAYTLAVEEFHPRRALHDLALCYNLCIELTQNTSFATPSVPPLPATVSSETTEQNFKHVPLGNGATYRVVPTRSHWTGLDVRTEQLDDAQGRVGLRIALPNGRFLREATVNLANLSNPHWLEFRFHPIANAAGTSFVITLTPLNPKLADCLRVYVRDQTTLYCTLRYA